MGLVGYEVFKRFVATVNYGKRILTLSLPSAFEYRGTGTVVPFTFNEHIPQVEGSLDGIAGKFDIDTGARDSRVDPGAVRREARAQGALRGLGDGSDGVGRRRAGARPSRPAPRRPPAGRRSRSPGRSWTSRSRRRGRSSDPYVAGNVGGGVLKRFNVTFDYGHQRLIFEPNANYARRDTYDRAGMWINRGPEGFEVIDVVAGGPADVAGLKVGDRITAIGGTPAGGLSLPAVRERFRTDPVGTKIKIDVRRDGKPRNVKIVLRDLVPE